MSLQQLVIDSQSVGMRLDLFLARRFLDAAGSSGFSRPGIVHRLDKDTSGVMIVAKNALAFQRLATQFKERSVSKEYLALVWGKLERETGIVNRPIGRHRSDRKRMSSVRFLAKARPAITEWVVEKY